jgi:1-acyl-sn-glycerol-3-phosphate acyltransferase
LKKSALNQYPSPLIVRSIRYFALAAGKLLWFIKYQNKENIPKKLDCGLIIAPNHQTYIDPVWVCAPINRKFRFMAVEKAFGWFLIGKIIKYLGAFPVGSDGSETRKAWRKAKKSLEEKATLIVFPEGERAFADGKLFPFKSGVVRLAMETGVPILPVTICGANKIWAQGMKYPRLFRRVKIIYHPLFEVPKPSEGEDLRAHLQKLTDELSKIIGAKLEI